MSTVGRERIRQIESRGTANLRHLPGGGGDGRATQRVDQALRRLDKLR
jgi:hypothetical protein